MKVSTLISSLALVASCCLIAPAQATYGGHHGGYGHHYSQHGKFCGDLRDKRGSKHLWSACHKYCEVRKCHELDADDDSRWAWKKKKWCKSKLERFNKMTHGKITMPCLEKPSISLSKNICVVDNDTGPIFGLTAQVPPVDDKPIGMKCNEGDDIVEVPEGVCVKYKFTLTNTGNVEVTIDNLADTILGTSSGGPLTLASDVPVDACQLRACKLREDPRLSIASPEPQDLLAECNALSGKSLAPGESVMCFSALVEKEDRVFLDAAAAKDIPTPVENCCENVATATGSSMYGQSVMDSDTATFCVVKEPEPMCDGVLNPDGSCCGNGVLEENETCERTLLQEVPVDLRLTDSLIGIPITPSTGFPEFCNPQTCNISCPDTPKVECPCLDETVPGNWLEENTQACIGDPRISKNPSQGTSCGRLGVISGLAAEDGPSPTTQCCFHSFAMEKELNVTAALDVEEERKCNVFTRDLGFGVTFNDEGGTATLKCNNAANDDILAASLAARDGGVVIVDNSKVLAQYQACTEYLAKTCGQITEPKECPCNDYWDTNGAFRGPAEGKYPNGLPNNTLDGFSNVCIPRGFPSDNRPGVGIANGVSPSGTVLRCAITSTPGEQLSIESSNIQTLDNITDAEISACEQQMDRCRLNEQ